MLVLERKPNSRFKLDENQISSTSKSSLLRLLPVLLPFDDLFGWKCNQTYTICGHSAVQAAAAEVCGRERVNALRPDRPISAARRSPSPPPPAPPRRTAIRGCLSFWQNTLPLEAVPLSPGQLVGFYGVFLFI